MKPDNKRLRAHLVAEIIRNCPYAPMHGGCHFPDCPDDCAGKKTKEADALAQHDGKTTA